MQQAATTNERHTIMLRYLLLCVNRLTLSMDVSSTIPCKDRAAGGTRMAQIVDMRQHVSCCKLSPSGLLSWCLSAS